LSEGYKIKCYFTSPTAFRAVKKEDPNGEELKKYDISCLKNLFLAGERLDPPTFFWLQELVGVPVIDHWWQTETGRSICANPRGIELLPIKYGSPTVAACGWDVQVLDEVGKPLERGKIGALAAKLPLPPGTLPTLWQNDDRYKSSYLDEFPGYYATGDAGYTDEDGYVFITGRVDDIINVAGHRLSTAEMEEVVASHKSVAECAVFGVHCDIKGQKPLGLVVLKLDEVLEEQTIQKEIINDVRKEIGAVASFRDVLIVSRLPKTRSGKILRKLLRNIADELNYNIPSTIDDPSIINEIIVV